MLYPKFMNNDLIIILYVVDMSCLYSKCINNNSGKTSYLGGSCLKQKFFFANLLHNISIFITYFTLNKKDNSYAAR